MVTTDTRTYATDRRVCMKLPMCELTIEHVSTVATSDKSTDIGNQTNSGSNVPADDCREGNGALCESHTNKPTWVGAASAELSGAEVQAIVVACDGAIVDLQHLNLDVAPESLKVELTGHEVLELRLPATVDVDSNPKAKWSEKTRTLKVRLALRAPSTNMA